MGVDEGYGQRDDSLRLLRASGVRADGALAAHRASNAGSRPPRLRCTLEDLTDCGGPWSAHRLHLKVEGTVRCWRRSASLG